LSVATSQSTMNALSSLDDATEHDAVNCAKFTYVIGDIQGCFDQLHTLYSQIMHRSPEARILFAGDLVNRGPKSLETLRFIKSLGERAESVLGNHDLHLLAVAHGIRKAHRSDTLDAILAAPDCNELLEWLRQRPLAIDTGHGILIHAGVFPEWTAEQTLSLADEVSTVLRSPDWLAFLEVMFSNTPDHWSEELTGHARWRCIVNALSRMRFCSADGVMDFSNKDGLINSDLNTTEPSMLPWFELTQRKTQTSIMILVTGRP